MDDTNNKKILVVVSKGEEETCSRIEELLKGEGRDVRRVSGRPSASDCNELDLVITTKPAETIGWIRGKNEKVTVLGLVEGWEDAECLKGWGVDEIFPKKKIETKPAEFQKLVESLLEMKSARGVARVEGPRAEDMRRYHHKEFGVETRLGLKFPRQTHFA
ncbi:MAG: hypothetical protein AB1468_05525 [Candidatus Micrarchaeota archaeon]